MLPLDGEDPQVWDLSDTAKASTMLAGKLGKKYEYTKAGNNIPDVPPDTLSVSTAEDTALQGLGERRSSSGSMETDDQETFGLLGGVSKKRSSQGGYGGMEGGTTGEL